MVATADDIAIGGNIAKTMIFSTTPKDADAMTPIWLTMTVIIKNEILINASCNAIGAPSTIIFLDKFLLSRISFRVNSKWNPCPCKNQSEITKLPPCAVIVANAAPVAPKWK